MIEVRWNEGLHGPLESEPYKEPRWSWAARKVVTVGAVVVPVAALVGIAHIQTRDRHPDTAPAPKQEAPSAADVPDYMRAGAQVMQVLENGGTLQFVHANFRIAPEACIQNPVIVENGETTYYGEIFSDFGKGTVDVAMVHEPLNVQASDQWRTLVGTVEIAPDGKNVSAIINQIGVGNDCKPA